MMRTQSEIVERVEIKSKEFLNFESEVLIAYLDFGHAKPFLKPEATETEWDYPLSESKLMGEMRKYMEFAIGKVEDHRSISASRSVNKMCAWLFLLSDDDLLAFAEDNDHYRQYGAPILKEICSKYFPDIEHSAKFYRMADGLPCRPDCDEGCSG